MKVSQMIKWSSSAGGIGLLSIPAFHYGLDMNMWLSAVSGVGVSGALMTTTGGALVIKKLTKRDPYKEEIAYIKHQVREAKKHLKMIGSSRFKVRSVTMWMQLTKLYKVAKSIIDMVDKEPIRYVDTQPFFQTYLPSTVTVIERYLFLATKPTKNIEVRDALRDAEEMIDEMVNKYDRLLKKALESDMENLNIELKILKDAFEDEKRWRPTSTKKIE
ncbi:5-bromo-4-chloroindolyl phosphate hydrolysis family protein [Priestia koreensis]|uniref:5-bromo-4-chloroindolyl phosphate hydrolysis protein n=1 Tax=Priestia koreensis TaxID=284581 RepID=A0A0M0L5E8_9BACI|nr:5-bromo-4-chloroindolyl phosphate hydrolysis family protein [Priestia koreensis]KOO46305.1 hypothetical protein AMD01_10680 [Priestia koreensis]